MVLKTAILWLPQLVLLAKAGLSVTCPFLHPHQKQKSQGYYFSIYANLTEGNGNLEFYFIFFYSLGTERFKSLFASYITSFVSVFCPIF